MHSDPTRPKDSSAVLPAVPGVRFIVELPGRPPGVAIVSQGQRVVVGRGDDADVVLADSDASRRHTLLTFDGDRVSAEDLGSTNGTWVGGRRLDGPAELDVGDVVGVGSASLTVVQVTRATGAAARESGPLDLGPDVVARDAVSVAMFRLLARLARTRLPLLLLGETGCGKEVAARVVHRLSTRERGPFVAINCATLVETLAESELFGHEKGAFSGATARRVGAFEAASGGTLFLDEVGDLSLTNQARLLRVLQEAEVVRVGSTTPVAVDTRVVAATHRDLSVDVSARRFREDLYYRLNGATVRIPPLRSRPQDLAVLVERALARSGGARLGDGVMAALAAYRWPGNVRELGHVIDRACAVREGDVVTLDDLGPEVGPGTGASGERDVAGLRDHVDEVERQAVMAALEAHNGNQTLAAKALGITRRALIYRMERHGLKVPSPSAR